MLAINKTELLEAIGKAEEGNPYNMVTGSVRLVAVDDWLNELQADGFIIGHQTAGGAWVKITPKGRRWLRIYQVVRRYSLEDGDAMDLIQDLDELATLEAPPDLQVNVSDHMGTKDVPR